MSKICLKNIKSQLRDCLPLQRSSRFAYSLKCSLMRLGHSKLRPCLSLNELTLFGFRLINLDYILGKLGVQTSK